MIKARDLKRGDCFMLQVSCEVQKVDHVAGGERTKVVVATINPGRGSIEFLDEGCSLAIVCKPGRQFSAYRPRNGGGGGDDLIVNPPDPSKLVDA